jgi:hypothetical protein
MATLSFEGETQDEIVQKVRRWLASIEGQPGSAGVVDVVERMSELTKDSLSIIAAAAPEPVAHSEIVNGLTHMGYDATDQTKRAVVSGLNAVAELSGDRLLKRVGDARKSITYEMQSAVARRVLKTLRGRL